MPQYPSRHASAQHRSLAHLPDLSRGQGWQQPCHPGSQISCSRARGFIGWQLGKAKPNNYSNLLAHRSLKNVLMGMKSIKPLSMLTRLDRGVMQTTIACESGYSSLKATSPLISLRGTLALILTSMANLAF